MSYQRTDLIFMIFGIVWVGGWGWVMYRHPGWFAKWNARFGFKVNQKLLRAVGVFEMILAAISAISIPVAVLLGWY